MLAVLAFLGALVAIVLAGIVVSRVRGGRAHYLDAWRPEPHERRLLEDPAADFYVVPRLGQARVMSFARRRRSHAVLTDARLVIATRALMSRRYMITHVIQLDRDAEPPADPPAELGQLSGGLYGTGYIVMSARPSGMTVEDAGARPYLRIVPEPTASATNVEHCRLYSDDAAGFLDWARSGG
jgi:hypothetical protein